MRDANQHFTAIDFVRLMIGKEKEIPCGLDTNIFVHCYDSGVRLADSRTLSTLNLLIKPLVNIMRVIGSNKIRIDTLRVVSIVQ